MIHDRDPLYTKQFDAIMESSGVKIKRLPAFMPVMNAFAEAFVKSIKTECINKMIITSEKQLRYIVNEFIEHYNHERPHRGLGGKMIEPYPQDENGVVVEFSRLGGCCRTFQISYIYSRSKQGSTKVPDGRVGIMEPSHKPKV